MREQKANIKKNLIISSVIIILIVGIGLGTKFYIDYRAEQKEVAAEKKYKHELDDVVETMNVYFEHARGLNDQNIEVWRDVIYNGYRVILSERYYDFNSALKAQQDKYIEQGSFDEIVKTMDKVEKNMKGLQEPPEKFKADYDIVVDIYKTYVDFSKLSIMPEGNLNSYTEKIASLDSDFSSTYREYQIRTK